MSIKPQWLEKILNEEKTIEIRKRFPSDYVGWVYIYCTKDGYLSENDLNPYTKYFAIRHKPKLTPNYMRGRVVARFWCDKVEEHKDFGMFPYSKLRYDKATCLSEEDLEDYGFVEGKGYVPLYAIHITKLEIFDGPKEISDFSVRYPKGDVKFNNIKGKMIAWKPLTRAPQSFCFIEI